MSRDRLSFSVLGRPQPKGSTRAFVPKGWARPIVTSDNKGVKAWEQAVRYEAQRAAQGTFFSGPVALILSFDLPRPASLPKRVTEHITRPDLDKLTRAVGDALTGVLWRDDSQVVCLDAEKHYAGVACGVRITVQAMAVETEARP